MSDRIVLRTSELRDVERAASALPLMERAGESAAADAVAMLANRPGRVLVLAGPGNNGGDGFVLARHLRASFHEVSVAFAADPERLPEDARRAAAAWRSAGGSVVADWDSRANRGLVVDALFGIGLTRPAGGLYADWIGRANGSGLPILALDVPSGLDAESGSAFAPVIRATRTATFIALKPGLLTGDGPDCCGEITVHSLGLDAEAAAAARGRTSDWASCAPGTPRRLRNSHKGTYGSLAILGGAPGMIGAVLLAARAASMLGAGKVHVGFVEPDHPQVDWQQPELMLHDATSALDLNPDVMVIGPGLGMQRPLPWLVPALRAAVPLVADADLLNRLAADASLLATLASRTAPTLATPHPAEAARLLGVTTGEVQHDRVGSALRLAERLQAQVVLKGCGSVCAGPDGSWFINTTGNPGLASGGSGDSLAGMLGALLAQRMQPRTALLTAVALHGAAADALVAEGIGPAGLVASELAPMARRLFNAAAR